jgi:hypothetical protein
MQGLEQHSVMRRVAYICIPSFIFAFDNSLTCLFPNTHLEVSPLDIFFL